MLRTTTFCTILVTAVAPCVWAGQVDRGSDPAAASTIAIDGPAPPQPPAVVTRDDRGQATVRAVRITSPLAIDGTLDERVYRDVPPIADFVQQDPVEGDPATEPTEFWLLFDDDQIYISARCWNSAPESEWVANDMRRDSFNIVRNERLAILLDTFYDRRNGIVLTVNPIGGRMDGQITDERNYNGDWNPVWDVQTGRFEGGWTMEAAIPFKSLRYRQGQTQVWGINLQRSARWKNELSSLTPLSRARGDAAIFQASLAAAVVGIEAPNQPLNLEVKPYAIADLTSDRPRQLSNDLSGDVGLDVKYGVTQNLVADLTINTDFAQVEADEQQVNLTRFSLFFPEKREFFLENQGIFAFGGAGAGAFGGGGNTPVLFYSRRIGLNRGREVPIDGGGRVTGRLGRFTLGVLNIQTGDVPEVGELATNYSVVRVRGDLMRRSSIGLLFTNRSLSVDGPGSGQTYGVDGLFSFHDNLNINTYWAQTRATHRGEDDVSYRAQLDYNGDRYGVQLEHLAVGDEFTPEVGFLRRDDFERSFASFRFSPRPASIAAIRKLSWSGSIDYITNRDGVLETRELHGEFGIEFENSDQLNLQLTRSHERLERPFRIATGVNIRVGEYDFDNVSASLTLGRQRLLSGRVAVEHGSFFGGTKTSLIFGTGGGFGSGRLDLSPQLSVEPGLSINRVELPVGEFTTHLVTTRTTYTVTPLMFVSALVQYNSSADAVSANLRLRWEYQPGSELFIVYNEERDTVARGFPALENRAFIVKINRLFRF